MNSYHGDFKVINSKINYIIFIMKINKFMKLNENENVKENNFNVYTPYIK